MSKLIKRKEGRLANLTKQADELEKSLAEAEGSDKGPLMKIIDMIADHKERITASCGVMKGRSLEMIAELEALSKCAKGEECGASDPKTQDAAPKADDASEMLKKEEAAASGAQGSATGSAAPAATAAAAPAATAAPAPTGSSEQVDESAPTKFNKSVLPEVFYGRTICERAPILKTELVHIPKVVFFYKKIKINFKGIKIFTI